MTNKIVELIKFPWGSGRLRKHSNNSASHGGCLRHMVNDVILLNMQTTFLNVNPNYSLTLTFIESMRMTCLFWASREGACLTELLLSSELKQDTMKGKFSVNVFLSQEMHG